jgi:hypothetical protein
MFVAKEFDYILNNLVSHYICIFPLPSLYTHTHIPSIPNDTAISASYILHIAPLNSAHCTAIEKLNAVGISYLTKH